MDAGSSELIPLIPLTAFDALVHPCTAAANAERSAPTARYMNDQFEFFSGTCSTRRVLVQVVDRWINEVLNAKE